MKSVALIKSCCIFDFSKKEIMSKFSKATEGSTVTITRNGEVFQAMVKRSSKVQIDIIYMKQYEPDKWKNAELSFAPNGNVKYIKEPETKILSLDIVN